LNRITDYKFSKYFDMFRHIGCYFGTSILNIVNEYGPGSAFGDTRI